MRAATRVPTEARWRSDERTARLAVDMAHHPPMSSPGGELRRVRSLIADLDGIAWEADARTMLFTFVSGGSTRILGYAPQEWLAEPTFWADHIHPEDRERMIAQFVRAATAGWSFDAEYRLIAKDGSVVWLRDLGHVVRDVEGRPTLLRGLMVDVTKQQLVEVERRSAEERFRVVVERLPAIVYLEAIEGYPGAPRPLLYVSPQLETILGFTTREWLANAAARSDRFVADDLERVQGERRRVEEAGEPFSAEYRMLARDGRIVWFRDEAVLVRDDEDRPVFWQGIMYDITRQRESEALARETETRYQALVEQLPVIVYSESVVGDSRDLTYINSRVGEILGVTPADWVADPVGNWMDRIHPDDRGAVEQENRRADQTGEPFTSEYRMFTADDRMIWIRDEAVLVRDEQGNPKYWQGVMTDITARREAENSLAEAEARYRALVEQTPTITYLYPAEGPPCTLYMSPQSTAILGYTPQDWYDDDDLFDKLVHPDDVERATHAPGSAEVRDATYRLIAKDGRTVWVHDQARLILDDEGKPKYWQGVLIDITEHEHAQELERDLVLEREAAQRLRVVDEMKNTFLQAVSHDLRTPLAGILGLAVTIAREDLHLDREEMRDMAGRIAQNARRLDRLVTDLLDLDRLTRGIIEPLFRPTDVGALVRELVADSELLADHDVDVKTTPIVIACDKAKVERIVENLLGNTVKHTPPTSRIWVRVEPWEGGALIVVEDDGPGVPPDQREKIFEAFQQGETASPHLSGVGVGLALVARFAELHDGGAWVEERPGGGASFRVFLPTQPAGYQPEPAIGPVGTGTEDDPAVAGPQPGTYTGTDADGSSSDEANQA
ncbi:MAG: PAS domain-containing sensor histidine kinase [Actinomycetota bacterium]